jgi:RNA polymerase-binding protein DksA
VVNKKSSSSSARSRAAKPTGKAPVAPPAPRDETPEKPLKLRKTYLSKKDLEEFREMLLEKRRSLLGDLSGMEAQSTNNQESGNLSNMPTHMADVGTDNFEHEFTLGLLESEQAMLREIEDALRRIADRSYGICLGTGEDIPKARLKAKPWAKYTVEYARLMEKGLIRPPDRNEKEDDADEAADADEPEHEEEEFVEEEAEPEE